jgi:ceramide glucosyltransferase
MMQLLAQVALAVCIAAMAYGVVALACVWRFGRRVEEFERTRPQEGGTASSPGVAPSLGEATLPGVTILKPVAGDEPRLFENLSSFCAQDYPQFHVVFGVADAGDPAVATVRRVMDAFPHVDLSLVIGADTSAPNFKVATLLAMAGACKHDILVIADADTSVGPSYLRAVVAPLSDAPVGAVTCAYRGRSSGGLASDLGVMMIDEQFIPSVLVASLGTVRFCLGATMAVRRRTLDAIGGFAALAPFLADDQKLGELVSRQGSRVALAPYVVEHDVAEPDMRSLWAHEVRWARTSRLARPWGYAGYFITYPLPLALIYAALSRDLVVASLVLGLAVALRLGSHYAARAALRTQTPDKPWLIPLRDVLGLAVWVASLVGRHVRWRDRLLTVDGAGRIISATG